MRFLFIYIMMAMQAIPCMAQNSTKEVKPGWGKDTNTKQTYNRFKEYDDSIPTVVYDHMTHAPVFQGGLHKFEQLIIDNLEYPAEAWNDTNYVCKDIMFHNCVVRADGINVFVPCKKMHPALHKEIARVMSTMPRWGPASLNGEIVDVVFSIQMSLLDPYFFIPLCAMPMVKESMKAAGSITERYPYGISKTLIDNVAGKIYDIHKKGWDEMGASLTGAKLFATTGDYDKAVELIQPELKRYHKLGFLNGTLNFVDSDLYYKPLHELEAAITLAAIYDMGGNKTMAKVMYDNAIRLIETFMEEGISGIGSVHLRTEHYYDLMHERESIVENSKSPGISLNPSERREIEYEPRLTDRHRLISEREKEGKISNARVKQIENKMYNMHKRSHNKNTKYYDIRLHKLCAMLIGLRDGTTAEKEYIASLASDKNINKNIAERLAKWGRNLDEPVYTRQQLLETIVLYAPLNVTGEKNEAAKAAADAFYDTRRELENIYPLKWLWK